MSVPAAHGNSKPLPAASFLRFHRSHEGFDQFRSQTHLTAPSKIHCRLSIGIFLSFAIDEFFLKGVKARSVCAFRFLWCEIEALIDCQGSPTEAKK